MRHRALRGAILLILCGGTGAWCPAPAANFHSLRRSPTSTCSPISLVPRVEKPRRCVAISMATQVPRNVKESIDQLRGAIQAALSERNSRMDIEVIFKSTCLQPPL